jgi:membrane fusion protein (multidrug efflux system)
VQVGARVGTGTKLFSLVSLQDMVARVYVPGRYLTMIQKDQIATVTSDFLPDRKFTGWVKRISPVIDPQSGTFKVTVGVNNPDRDVLPGLFVKAAIVTEERPNALLVPKRAVVYDGGGQFLFTVRDGQAVRLPLTAGFETPDTIEVRSGLKEGDPVIVRGQSGLKDETPVKVVNPDDSPVLAALPKTEKADAKPESPES